MPEFWIYKPARNGKKWRIRITDTANGESTYRTFESKEEADKLYLALKEEEKLQVGKTFRDYLKPYSDQLLTRRKLGSVTTTLFRLKNWTEELDSPAVLVTKRELTAAWESIRTSCSADTARNTLAEFKSFLVWLANKKQIQKVTLDWLEDLTPAGRRHRGKAQLRPGEAKLFLDHCLAHGGEGEVCAAAVLLLGLRQSELTLRTVRDVDRLTRTLHIDAAKTEAGDRVLEIPEVLWPHFERRILGRKPTEPLFPAGDGGFRQKEWLSRNSERICRALGLPVVCAHGLRGTHSSLARSAGLSAHVVAQQLGHSNEQVTLDHYIRPGIEESEARKRVLRVLDGGKS